MSIGIFNSEDQSLVKLASNSITADETIETLNDIKVSVATDKASVAADKASVSADKADIVSMKSEIANIKTTIDETAQTVSENANSVQQEKIAIDETKTDIDKKYTEISNTASKLNTEYNNLTSNYYTKEATNSLISSTTKPKYSVVNELPTSDISTDIIYLKSTNTTSTDGIYEMYTYQDSNWVKIGTSNPDLADYYTKELANSTFATKNEINNTNTEVSELKGDLNNQTTFADDVHLNGNKTYSIGRYVNKSINNNGNLGVDSPKRASTIDLYYIPINAIVLTNANTGYQIWMYYYDEHKNFLSSVFSSEARYFRACVVRDDNGNITTEEAKSNASFVCSYDVPQMPTKISQLDNDENYAKKTDIPTLYYTEHTVNIYDKSKRTAGYMSGKDTIDSSNTAYDTSDFISVEKGTYVFQMSINTADVGRMTYTTYDRNKHPLTFENMTNVHFVAITMESDGYIKVCTYNAMMAKKAMVSKGTEPLTEFVSFKEWETIDSKAVADNPLYGKKWCVLGDSFTNGATGNTLENGRYKGEKKVYPYFIGNRQNMDIVSFFAGGRTLSYPEVSNGFVNSITCPTAECYYQNIPEDADYITIYLGINDSHHRSSSSGGDGEDNTGIIPIGTIDDITVYTYYGAWNVVLTWLLENRPFAHIGIIVSNGCDTAEYRTAQLDIAKKYGIPYIDLNGDERTPTMIRSQNPNISQAVKNIVDKKQAVDYDGSKTGSVNLHPNDYAHEYESYFIENFLRSI